MADPIPVNLSSIEARQAQQEAGKLIARQLMSSERFQEEVEVGFNPGAVEREQSRLSKFKPINNRILQQPKEQKKIKEVDKKAEEDLARQFNRRNQELPEDRLAALKKNLRPNSTAQQVLDDVTNEFTDATLADEALDYLEQVSDADLRETVQQARQIHQNTKNREIIAGRNVNPAAQQYHAKGLGQNPTELRQLYREITGNPQDHNALFTELSNRYPFNELKAVVNFLLKALGYDVKSKGPSIEKGELLRLMAETRNLQSILWVYLFFRSRMKLVYSQFKKTNMPITTGVNFEKLAKEFIKLVDERYPGVLKLLKQMDDLGMRHKLMGKIILLSQFRDAIRQLSPRLYKSLKHRQDLLLVILEALEELEDEEEERREKEELEKEEEQKAKKKKKPIKDTIE